jgi:hypothetical protein
MINKFSNKISNFERKKNVLFLFPNYFKIIGLCIAIPSFIALFFLVDIITGDFYISISEQLTVLGMLLFTLSKENEEDERIRDLRYRAFAFAVVVILVVQVLLPFFIIMVSLLVGNHKFHFTGLDVYMFMLILLVAQAAYFHKFKKEL